MGNSLGEWRWLFLRVRDIFFLGVFLVVFLQCNHNFLLLIVRLLVLWVVSSKERGWWLLFGPIVRVLCQMKGFLWAGWGWIQGLIFH